MPLVAQGAMKTKTVPIQLTDCSVAIAEGLMCWDTDDDILYVGTGSIAVGTGGVDADAISIVSMINGATPPAAVAVLSSTNKANIRNFSGTANEDMLYEWMAPIDFVGTTVTFRVIGWVSQATAPANGEIVAFSLSGVSVGNSELLSSTQGTAQTASLTADATYAQYDRLATGWSSAITVTGIAAGESVLFKLTRLATTTDTYAQDFGVSKIEVRY